MTENLRRRFLQSSAALAGGAFAAVNSSQATAAPVPRTERLPREVWVGTVSMAGLREEDSQAMCRQLLQIMGEMAAFQPDVICLPETFTAANVRSSDPLPERAEAWWDTVLQPFSNFAKQYHCNLVCPVHTESDGAIYNSAVFIDRRGETLGRYHKIHATTGEMSSGVSAGPLEPPIFEADFGKVGAQICFDIEWDDGWKSLSRQGAEIVFWPSAFGGGKMVNTRAWENRYAVVSSTWKNTSKICDIDGSEIAKTSHWNRWTCAPINLEKAFLHTWPFVQRFDEIQAKYGRQIRITNHAEEEWSILESRSPDLKIADVLKEFELKTIKEHLLEAENMQCDCRPS